MRLFSHPWVPRIFFATCLVIVATHAMVIAHRREQHGGDYDVSREMGRRFLVGEHLYAGGLHYPYTPTAAMSFAPLALVRPGLGLAVRYAAALAGLWLALRWLRAMVWQRRRLDATIVFGVEVLSLVLASHYIIRDLDDGGPHLLLLTILVGGIYCVWRGREALGASCFGLATVLKAPAGLFLPFFLWKRQWRLAGMAVAATIAWTILPMAWMGYANWWAHQEEWTRTALRSVLGDPTPGVKASEQRVQNQSLKLAVTRYLVTYPSGHPLRLSHPGYVSTMDVDPDVARWMAAGILGLLLLLCAWLTRGGYRGPDDPRWLLECSAVLILALLLSPVTWTQHLVLIIPALYLIMSQAYGIGRLGSTASVAVWAYVILALLLNRELLGKGDYILLLSYHIHTLALLLVLAVILFRRPAVHSG